MFSRAIWREKWCTLPSQSEIFCKAQLWTVVKALVTESTKFTFLSNGADAGKQAPNLRLILPTPPPCTSASKSHAIGGGSQNDHNCLPELNGFLLTVPTSTPAVQAALPPLLHPSKPYNEPHEATTPRTFAQPLTTCRRFQRQIGGNPVSEGQSHNYPPVSPSMAEVFADSFSQHNGSQFPTTANSQTGGCSDTAANAKQVKSLKFAGLAAWMMDESSIEENDNNEGGDTKSANDDARKSKFRVYDYHHRNSQTLPQVKVLNFNPLTTSTTMEICDNIQGSTCSRRGYESNYLESEVPRVMRPVGLVVDRFQRMPSFFKSISDPKTESQIPDKVAGASWQQPNVLGVSLANKKKRVVARSSVGNTV